MDKGIKYRTSHDRVVELVRMYSQLMIGFDAETEHEELLFNHAKALHHRLRLLAVKEQDTYSIHLSDVECLALKQTWERGHNIAGWTNWNQVIIDSIMDLISKQFHQLEKSQNTI